MKNFVFILGLLILNCFIFNVDFALGREKYKNSNVVSTSDEREIKNLEERLFNYSFENESILNRLERLELKVFNIVSTDTYKNRINALTRALNASYNYPTYTNVGSYYQYGGYNPYFYNRNPLPYYASQRLLSSYSPLRNLRTYFKGAMTGYTLPVQNNLYRHPTNYNPNNNFFSNGGSSYEYSGNDGYYYNNTSNDGGVSVKILK